MANIVVAPSISAELARLKSKPPHALLLHGEPGVGLATLADDITHHAAYVLQPLDVKAVYDPIRGTINGQAIRELYQHTRGQGDRQYVVIDDADRMNSTAQNALLKLLEEPPAHVRFVLTTHNIESMLPTIRSRTQQVHVPRVSQQASKKLLDGHNLSPEQATQLLFIGGGRPALITRLATNPRELEEAARAMKDARTFLSATSAYERAMIAVSYASTRQTALILIDSALRIAEHTLKHAPTAAIADSADTLLDVRTKIVSNASPRLQLMRIVVK